MRNPTKEEGKAFAGVLNSLRDLTKRQANEILLCSYEAIKNYGQDRKIDPLRVSKTELKMSVERK